MAAMRPALVAAGPAAPLPLVGLCGLVDTCGSVAGAAAAPELRLWRRGAGTVFASRGKAHIDPGRAHVTIHASRSEQSMRPMTLWIVSIVVGVVLVVMTAAFIRI